MDKTVNPFVYEPQRSSSTDATQRSILAKEASHSRAVQSKSFEAALDQIRQRGRPDAVPDKSPSIAGSSEQEATDKLQTDSPDPEATGINQDPQAVVQGQAMSAEEPDSELSNATAVSVQRSVHGPENTLIPANEHELVAASVNETAGAVSGVAESGSAAATSPVAAPEHNTLHGRMTAEQVSSLMRQLENTAGEATSQWRFGVVDDPAGVTDLQLQRNVHGEWRVSVSFEPKTPVDTRAQAEELKQSLLDQGHSVDSVFITRASHQSALNDD